MQTFSVHYPQTGKGKMKVISKPTLGHYPVALIPGQFTDHYRTYSSNQLKYMPLNTAIKSAPKNPKAFHMAVATAKSNELKRKKSSQFGTNKRPRSDESNSDRYYCVYIVFFKQFRIITYIYFICIFKLQFGFIQ